MNIINGYTDSSCIESDKLSARNTNNMVMILNLKDASDEFYDDIPEQTMRVGAEMFFYLNSCPSSSIMFWTKFFFNALQKTKGRRKKSSYLVTSSLLSLTPNLLRLKVP